MAGKFHVQRQHDAPRTTANNNEHQCRNNGGDAVAAALVAALWPERGRPYGRQAPRAAPVKQKPGAVSRPGATRQFQFRKYSDLRDGVKGRRNCLER
jgi:hypothetical protein